MVKDLDLQADSSTEIYQDGENKSPSTKEQSYPLKSAVIPTAEVPTSPLSCSMDVGSQVASTAGHLPTLNQILDHNTSSFTIGNDHLRANNYHINHNMDDTLALTTNSSSPILPERKTAELTKHQNEVEEMAIVATEKAVRKKRGRGRPTKLKPSKQEKDLEHQREEVSSASSINSMNSFEKDPLCEDFDLLSLYCKGGFHFGVAGILLQKESWMEQLIRASQ